MATWNLVSAPSLTHIPAPEDLDPTWGWGGEKSKRRQSRVKGQEEKGPGNVAPTSTPPTSS